MRTQPASPWADNTPKPMPKHTRISMLSLTFAAALAGHAHADTYDAQSADILDKAIKDVAPAPGVARAPVRAPAWCKAIKPESGYSLGGFIQALDNTKEPLRAAKVACSFPGTDKAVQRAAAAIEQTWMNETGLDDAGAAISIAIQLDEKAYGAGKNRLCASLVENAEAVGEEALYTTTRRHLFGCDADRPAWQDDHRAWHDELPGYLDQSATPADALVRLGYVLNRVKPAFEDPKYGNAQKNLSAYGVDSYDFRMLSDDDVKKTLDSAPYKNNVYAQSVVLESLGRARMGIAILDARVAALVKDPDWKEILIDAPKRGAAAFEAAAKPYEAEIQRSNAFELAASSGSKKRVAGCDATLRADFMTVLAKLPHHNAEETTASLSDPIASLLFQRLVQCLTLAGDPVAATELGYLRDRDVRYSRGPRTAAYYAQIEALAKILAERPRFQFSLDRMAFDFKPIGPRGAGGGTATAGSKGIVKTATKKGGVLHVVFPTTKTQVMNRTCVDTNRLIQIRTDGSLQWEQRCHDAGWVTIDVTPEPMDVPVGYDAGVRAGSYVELAANGFPKAVYTDKSKAKLVNFYGFAL
jgi:hypothetical protein